MTDLFLAAKNEGITIEYCRLPTNGSISVQDEDGDFVLMDYSLLTKSAEERVHLAHELGHCVTGSFYSPYSESIVRKKGENKADKWAIQKLITKSSLRRAIKKGYVEIWSLAEYFNVTEAFIRKALSLYIFGNLSEVCDL